MTVYDWYDSVDGFDIYYSMFEPHYAIRYPNGDKATFPTLGEVFKAIDEWNTGDALKCFKGRSRAHYEGIHK